MNAGGIIKISEVPDLKITKLTTTRSFDADTAFSETLFTGEDREINMNYDSW